MKVMTLIALAGLSGVLLAEPVKLDAVGQFGKKQGVTTEGDVITVNGMQYLKFKEKFPVDPNAKYKLSCEIQLPAGAKGTTFLGGFFAFDKKGTQLQHQWVMGWPETETTLKEDVKKGDKVVKVVNGEKWIKAGYAYVAFNVKADGSDLPNRELTNNVLSVEKNDGFWTITLNNPVQKDYPAGTAVREHVAGGYIYTFSAVPKGEWVKLSGTCGGIPAVGNGKNNGGKLWPCTAQIQPMLMPNWNFKVKDGAVQIRNVTFEEVK